jgi:hypothetical protein
VRQTKARFFEDFTHGALLDRSSAPAPRDVMENIFAALTAIPDMGEARCKGMHPFFDWPDYEQATEDRPETGTRLQARHAHHYFDLALSFCAACPLARDGSCIKAALDGDREFSGVAGGEVFHNGRRIKPPLTPELRAKQLHDEALEGVAL